MSYEEISEIEIKENADRGNTNAMLEYANILYYINHNEEEARRYYEMSISGGNVYAMFQYAEILLKDYEDNESAIVYYKLAADNGNIEAMFLYGNMLLCGYIIEKNIPQALEYIKRAADNRQADAALLYAKLNIIGREMPKNLELAFEYLNISAEIGNVEAIDIYIILCYYLYKGKPEEFIKGQNEKSRKYTIYDYYIQFYGIKELFEHFNKSAEENPTQYLNKVNDILITLNNKYNDLNITEKNSVITLGTSVEGIGKLYKNHSNLQALISQFNTSAPNRFI